MNRRTFIIDVSAFGIATALNSSKLGEPVFGHNQKKYKWDKNWAQQQQLLPVNDCHEMVFTSKNEIFLLTNHTENNVIVFDKSGKINRSWGNQFPGAHGLSIHGEEEQTLFITDTERNQFFQTTLDGKIVKEWSYPKETDKYENQKQFVPTETAITENGEIYVADGYGSQYITHYDENGKIKNIFGGRGKEEQHFETAHGITIDYRTLPATLIITDRPRCCFKRFTLEGIYIETILLPGANVCRPVIRGEYLYAAVLTTEASTIGSTNTNTGYVIILDKNNKLISCIGGSSPLYIEGKCKPIHQTLKLFNHPHDVMIDDEENLYVCQWNSGKVYPYKFNPIT